MSSNADYVQFIADQCSRKPPMKKQLSEKIAFAPLPVLILATWNEDGTANAMNAAWGVQSDWAEVTVFLADHRTTDNLKAKRAFTVSFADRAAVERLLSFVGK